MPSLTNYIVEIGSVVAAALWASVALLKAVLVPAIGKIKTSDDLRFVVRQGLIATFALLTVGVIGVLALSRTAPTIGNPPDKVRGNASSVPTATSGADKAVPGLPITSGLLMGDEYPGHPPNYLHQSAGPPPLQSPHAGSGVAEQSNGS